VMGMTPEVFAAAEPYLTTRGQGLVNLNTAPVPVLRALPGITDAAINTILQYRSQGRRIANVNEVFPQDRAVRGQVNGAAFQRANLSRITVNTTDVEFTFSARVGPQAPPSKLTVVMTHQGEGGAVRVTYKQW